MGVVLLVVAVIVAMWFRAAPPAALAAAGVLDLSKAESAPSAAHELTGEWQLRPGVFLDPADLGGGQSVPVPAAWNTLQGGSTGMGTLLAGGSVAANLAPGRQVRALRAGGADRCERVSDRSRRHAPGGPIEIGLVAADAREHVPRMHCEILEIALPGVPGRAAIGMQQALTRFNTAQAERGWAPP